MKAVFIFVLVSFSTTCFSQTNTDSLRRIRYDSWRVKEFKGYFFRRCLQTGYNKSNEIKKLLESDPSYVSDFNIGINNYPYIDELADSINQIILLDSIEQKRKWTFPSKEYDYKIAKHVIYHCLNYYESEDLDSIAKSRIKQLSF